MLKHLVSVYEILTTDKEFSNEVIEEKFNDLINYFIIYEIINLEAIRERASKIGDKCLKDLEKEINK